MGSPPYRPFLAASLAVALCASTAHALPPAAPAGLDAHVERVRKEFELPGFAIAIVKDGQVVVARGYGVRQLGTQAPVDEQTLFAIASNSKAFTATALALLVEEGKLDWNAPVVRYLPWFQLSDPYVTRELTVRDLLVHRSGLGLGAGDLLWWPPSNHTRAESVRKLRGVPLATSFRGNYAYDNVLYLVAGELIHAVSGQDWEQFVASRILDKVGMTQSKPRFRKPPGNVASPHARMNGTIRPVEPFVVDNANPAAGVMSSAGDLAKWMTVQLGAGRLPDGTALFSPRTSKELFAMVTPMTIAEPTSGLEALRPNFRGYALGFEVRDYRGHKLVTHGGVLPGYYSRVTMVPELGLGVAVLTNQESTEALGAVTYHVLDHYLGAPPTDWVAAHLEAKRALEAKAAEAERKVLAAREANTRPSLPLGAYAGDYADAWYGDVAIKQENDRLVIRFAHTPMLVGDLEHWQFDTFVARWRNRELRADAFVTFALNPDGTIDQVKLRPVSPATDFSFDFQDLLLKPAPGKPAEQAPAPKPPTVKPPVAQTRPGQ
ncbi:MAG TPA: serine hydrolase [Longimicrobium sp.]|nr:serine hydrolase [Longimicrobium sp.]